MKRVSVQQLADLTGKAWRTIRNRLAAAGLESVNKRGNAHLFNAPAALAAIYAPDLPAPASAALDPPQEKARADKERADQLALDNAIRRSEVAYLPDVIEVWGRALVSFRARLLAAPSKLAPIVSPENPNRARAVIEGELVAILAELSMLELGCNPDVSALPKPRRGKRRA